MSWKEKKKQIIDHYFNRLLRYYFDTNKIEEPTMFFKKFIESLVEEVEEEKNFITTAFNYTSHSDYHVYIHPVLQHPSPPHQRFQIKIFGHDDEYKSHKEIVYLDLCFEKYDFDVEINLNKENKK